MLVICGNFDREKGKSSYIGEQIAQYLNCASINGGNLKELDIDFKSIDVLLWMPNIDNTEDKILPNIKKLNPKLILISSKDCRNRDFTYSDMIGRLLSSHSNLGLMIEENYLFTLIDPLGNVFCRTHSIQQLCKSICERLNCLTTLTRVSSIQIGEERTNNINPEFISFVRKTGQIFSNYINAINPNRFLGNAATRCSYGFPATRINNRIYISKRNMDKREITNRDFVEIQKCDNHIGYYGNNKPSVDAPIQLELFDYYQNMNYIIHGHVYIKKAPFTSIKIPCGYIEEVKEIINLFPDRNTNSIAVNLLGHGCLLMFADYPTPEYYSRSIPEI